MNLKNIFTKKYSGISDESIPVNAWEYNELNIASSSDPFRNLAEAEVIETGKRRWQASSGSCVVQTVAGGHDNKLGLETSAVPIYQARSNKPAQGMSYQDVVKLLPSKRIFKEADVPSQSMTDSQMDNQPIEGVSYNPVYEVFLLPKSFDEVAKAVRQNGFAAIWFKGTFDEWQRWIIPTLSSSNQVSHSVRVFEAVRVDGVEYLVFLDSAGYYRADSKQPSWLKTDGLRAITRKAFEQGVFNQWTVRPIQTAPVATKPKYTFNYDLNYGMLNNKDVKELQKVLIYEKFLDKDAATGNYKNMTRSAVKAWQVAHKVASTEELNEVNGMRIGQKSRAKLNKIYSK